MAPSFSSWPSTCPRRDTLPRQLSKVCNLKECDTIHFFSLLPSTVHYIFFFTSYVFWFIHFLFSCTSHFSLYLHSLFCSMVVTWDDVNDNIFIHHSMMMTMLPKNSWNTNVIRRKHNEFSSQGHWGAIGRSRFWRQPYCQHLALSISFFLHPVLKCYITQLVIFLCLSVSSVVSSQVNTIVLVSPMWFRGRCSPIRHRANHFLMNCRLLLHMKTISARAMWSFV